MTDLKKCPFCGSNAGVLEYRRLSGPTLYKVVCNSRKCRGHDGAGSVGAWLENGWRESREEAAELWNRRSERICRAVLPPYWRHVEEIAECSVCGRQLLLEDDDEYCPRCGAKVVEHAEA